ncbi:MAG: M14 family zinc carboxypeptidase [Candidatus Oleimicrobiaceae bacterium]
MMSRTHWVAIVGTWLASLGMVQGQEHVRVRVFAPAREQVEKVLAHEVEVLATDFGRSLDVTCAPGVAAALAAAGLEVVPLQEEPVDPWAQGFHTYAETRDFLFATAAAHPHITRLDSIGSSVQGRGIWALKISDNPLVDEDEPCFLVEGCIHGNENHGLEACLHFIRYLVNGYGVDQQVTSWVEGREIWVVPLVNPDGHEMNRRTNANGVDLNRNFGYWWSFAASSYGSRPFSEPETRAIRDLAEAVRPYGSISFHTSGRLVLYPWAYIDAPATPDERLFALTARELVDSINVVSTLGRYNFRRSGTWYWHGGEHNDWMYSQYGMVSFTIEMMNSQSAPPSDEENEAVLPALRVMLRLPDHDAVTGRVADAALGTPLPARISIGELFDPEQPIFCYAEPLYGRYIRIVTPGTYTLQVYAPGYPRHTSHLEIQTRAPAVVHDVSLGPGPDLQLEALVVSDSGAFGQQGDGNGQINPGEVVRLLPRVRNDGAGAARDVRAVVRSSSPLVRVLADSVALGDLLPGAGVQAPIGFLARIAGEARPGQLLKFDVHLAEAGGNAWPLASSLRVQGFSDDMEEGQEQWTHGAFPNAPNQQDDWHYGLPLGEGGDPSVAHSGRFVWGTDLGAGNFNGSYANNVHTYLQMRTLNCRGWKRVYLGFYRWLNMQQGDRAYITVNDQVVWDNGYQALGESSWSYQTVDLTPFAAERDSVVIRFCLWSNGSGNSGGWTIDDVEVSDKLQVGVVDASPRLPTTPTLCQNYPNPFNASTTLVVVLPVRSEVSLSIYNLVGQEVRRLLAGVLSEGEHPVAWQGDDQDGHPVASGLYVAMLRAGGERYCRKLLVVR